MSKLKKLSYILVGASAGSYVTNWYKKQKLEELDTELSNQYSYFFVLANTLHNLMNGMEGVTPTEELTKSINQLHVDLEFLNQMVLDMRE